MKISIIQPSRNNLKYLKWSYESIRKNQGDHNVQICVADDASTDGTAEWCKQISAEDPDFDYIINDSGERVGHTILYDKLVIEVAKHDVCMIFHADMYLMPNALDSIEKYMYTDGKLNEKTIVSLTRIEPPLHPDGVEKIIKDFGVEPEQFDEEGLLAYYRDQLSPRSKKPTNGIFAPWAFSRQDFIDIGGHDPLYSPQSKEDSFHGDTIAMVIFDGYKKMVKVSDLWQMYSELIQVREDNKEVIDLKDLDVKVLTPLQSGQVGVSKLNGILRHKVDSDKMVMVIDRHGLVSITKDHSLIGSNLDAIKPNDVQSLWKPTSFSGSLRRNQLKELRFTPIGNVTETKRNDYWFPEFENIDEYGNDERLKEFCDFLGFYVAEGSTNENYIKICGNDPNELDYYAKLFCKIFNTKPVKRLKNTKRDHDDVYQYTWESKRLASAMREMVGKNSMNKKVPDFIFNLPKVYQKQFLYGYLRGDGYLGTQLQYSGYDKKSSISVDKRLFFKKDVFQFLQYKSASKSQLLTSGLFYLLKYNFRYCDFRISYQKDKDIYNISSSLYEKQNTFKVSPVECEDDELYVYDFDVNDTNMFLGGVGLIALHNSDIFNRFKLDGFEFIQTWDGYVYHMTCRGSRFNPNLTRVGQNSPEWNAQNEKSHYNFIRKWGMEVRHDEFLHPEVTPKYDIGIVLLNVSTAVHKNNLIREFEVRCSNLYIDNPDAVEAYIYKYGDSTDYDMTVRVKVAEETEPDNDVVVIIDLQRMTDNEFRYFLQLPLIIADSGKANSEMSLGSMVFKFKDIKRIESQNIKLNS